MKTCCLSCVVVAAFFSCSRLPAQTNWTRCSEGLPDGKTVLSLAQIGTILYAGTQKAGVFKSHDNGDTWQPMPQHPVFLQSSTASLAVIDTFLFAGQIGKGVLRTSLHDTAWTLLNSGLLNTVVQDLIGVNSSLYAATYGGGVFYSGDLGNSWISLYGNQGMEDHKAISLAHNATMLYAGTTGTNTIPDTGVAYRTAIGGTAWTRINTGFIRNGVHLEEVLSLAAVDTLVFAGTDDVGLFRSTDDGDNWEPVGGYNGDIHAIKISGSTVYYGTSYHGIFRSLDTGLSWSEDNTGFAYGNTSLPNFINDFLVAGPVIYAASDIGVFKQTVPILTSGVTSQFTASPELRNFPNPFLTHTTIHFYNSQPGPVMLRLLDIHGKTCSTILQKDLPEGRVQIDLDGQNLPDGLYFLRLDTGTSGGIKVIKVLKQH